MKSKNGFFLFLVFWLISHYSYCQKPRAEIKGDNLIPTEWSGNGKFTAYTPENSSLGCHSVAISQILFYHKLLPTGVIKYKCSNGFEVNEEFSNDKFDINQISNTLSETTPESNIKATAFYNYAIACIIQKDFGTNQYVNIENSQYHKTQVEKHFNCIYESYAFNSKSGISEIFSKNKSINKTIKKELDNNRPIGFYYDGPGYEGHAVIIDGYKKQKGNFYVHVNFGWGGKSNGWYLIEQDLPERTQTVVILTIKPNDT